MVTWVLQINIDSFTDLNNAATRLEARHLPQPISSIAILAKNLKEVRLVGFAELNNSLLATIDLAEDTPKLTVLDSAQNPIEGYVANRLSAGEFLGTTFSQDIANEKKYLFQCFGMAVSPLGDYIAFLHSIVPDGQLRYPITSNLKYRISFLVLNDYEECLTPEKIANSTFDSLKIAPLTAWWKIQVILKTLRSKQRETYKEQFLEHLQEKVRAGPNNVEDIVGNAASLEDAITEVMYKSSALDNFRIFSHYALPKASYPLRVLERLAFSVLKFLENLDADASSEFATTTFDKAIILSYCQTLLAHSKNDSAVATAKACLVKYVFNSQDPSATTLTLPGEGFEETYNFSAASDVYVIESERQHQWRRCSTTLLPLTYYQGKTCSGCARPIIGLEHLPQDQVGSLLKTIFAAVDICIYCGCRFTDN